MQHAQTIILVDILNIMCIFTNIHQENSAHTSLIRNVTEYANKKYY